LWEERVLTPAAAAAATRLVHHISCVRDWTRTPNFSSPTYLNTKSDAINSLEEHKVLHKNDKGLDIYTDSTNPRYKRFGFCIDRPRFKSQEQRLRFSISTGQGSNLFILDICAYQLYIYKEGKKK